MFTQTVSNPSATQKKMPFGRAVVIGGSIAGLTAARVLSDYFDTVAVIERTTFANGRDFPKGVPQARHPHLILVRGERILEEMFPGFAQNLLDGGAQRLNMGRDLRMRAPDGWLPQYQTEMAAIATSRRLLDHTVYTRLTETTKVSFKQNSDVMSICTDEENQRAIGVQIRNRTTGQIEDLPAEFVVDASGRSSKAPEWLTQLGFAPPEAQTVNAFPGYATRLYEVPDSFDHSWKTLYIMPNPPHISRGAIIVPMEGNLWHVSLIGMNGDCPPADENGFMEFARSLVSPEVYDALQTAKPVSPIWGYRRAENRLRRFDSLDRYLEGFVALGDAVYALNPVYGQGMTLASIASQLLGHCLAKRAEQSAGNDFTGLAQEFQKQLKNELMIPWQTATNEDMRWPETTGKQELDAASKMISGYFKMVLKTMPHSEQVTDAFFHVQHMIAPPTVLMRPRILAEVIKTNLSLRFSDS